MAEDPLADATHEQLRARIKQLEEENKKWMRLAGINRLTNLPNNLMLYQVVLPRALRGRTEESDALACILLCPDGIGEINQKHGRLAGDRLITQIGAFLKQQVGENERLFHHDGANFALLMLEASENKARRKGTQVKADFAKQTFTLGKIELSKMTMSAGVAEIEEGLIEKKEITTHVDQLYHKLSDRLYKAKERGGNSVIGS